ncbi:Nitroreductase-like protein [Aspergillus heterothallicus]
MGSHPGNHDPIPSLPDLCAARYKTTPPPEITPLTTPANPILATLLQHRTIRTFHTTPLPPRTLPTLLASAQSTSTPSMLQTYSILSLESPTQKAVVASLSGNQPFPTQAPLFFLLFCADLSHMSNLATKADSANSKALANLDMFLTATIDASLAAQNAAIAAEALGLGMCLWRGMMGFWGGIISGI